MINSYLILLVFNMIVQGPSTPRVMSLIKWGYDNENEVMCSTGVRGCEYGIRPK